MDQEPKKRGRKPGKPEDRRTFFVQVRFKPGNIAVIRQYVEDLNGRLIEEGKKPHKLSEVVRMLAWKAIRPPGDTSSG